MADMVPIFALGLYADKYPVTVARYARWDSTYRSPWSAATEADQLPVTNISWEQARQFAAHNGCRLPTTPEWIFMATGAWLAPDPRQPGVFLSRTEPRPFPWGSAPDPSHCNCRELGLGHPTPVDAFNGRGESFFGLSDLMGNVWEMTESTWTEALTGRVPTEPDNRTMVGGYFDTSLHQGGLVGENVWKMDMLLEDAGNSIIGFRCVRDFSETEVLRHAADIHRAWVAFLRSSSTLTLVPPEEGPQCDACGHVVPAARALALGTAAIAVEFYCAPCFGQQVDRVKRCDPVDHHRILFYGPAVMFLLAYIRGHVAREPQLSRPDKASRYARRCRLQWRPLQDVSDGQTLLTELTTQPSAD